MSSIAYISENNLQSIFSSETYAIQDCKRFDGATSDKSSNYLKTSNLSITHDTDHYILATSTDNQFLVIDEDYDNVSFEAEIKLLEPATYGNDPIGIMDRADNLYNTALMTVELNRTQFLTISNGSYGATASRNVSKQNSKYYRYVVIVNGNSVTGKVYDGDTLLYNQTISKSLNKKYYVIGLTNNPCTMHIKNIKIKPL